MCQNNYYPFVSVIMPIRNEARYIERSLGTVLGQDYASEQMEVLIADGLSTDNTHEIIAKLQKEYPSHAIKVIENPGQIVPTGMNAAIPLAKGEIIIRVDGHCEIAHDYVRRCVDHIQQEGVDGVGGAMVTIGETWLAEGIALAMSSPFGVGGSAFRTIGGQTMLTDSVPFPAYTRKIIEQAGLYDEELVRNQDDEYNYRLRKLGAKILLAADVHSRYYSRSSLKSLFRQYYQYGYWKVRVLQKHPRQMRPRQFVPPLFALALLISAIVAFVPTLRPISPIPGLLYLVANLIASLYVAFQHGWRYLFLLPLVYAILHVSYGLGFLVGMVKFANRWGDKQGKVPNFNP